jgi:hypothetical protein
MFSVDSEMHAASIYSVEDGFVLLAVRAVGKHGGSVGPCFPRRPCENSGRGGS